MWLAGEARGGGGEVTGGLGMERPAEELVRLGGDGIER